VLGCSTGEEAYSIGILLREHMAKLDRRGFGSELIEQTLRYELDAETELEFTPGACAA
jgi:hypothetical protein